MTPEHPSLASYLALSLIVLLNLTSSSPVDGDGYQAGISFSIPFPTLNIYARNSQNNSNSQPNKQPATTNSNEPATSNQPTDSPSEQSTPAETDNKPTSTEAPPTPNRNADNIGTDSKKKINKSTKSGKVIIQIGTVEGSESLKGIAKEIKEIAG